MQGGGALSGVRSSSEAQHVGLLGAGGQRRAANAAVGVHGILAGLQGDLGIHVAYRDAVAAEVVVPLARALEGRVDGGGRHVEVADDGDTGVGIGQVNGLGSTSQLLGIAGGGFKYRLNFLEGNQAAIHVVELAAVGILVVVPHGSLGAELALVVAVGHGQRAIRADEDGLVVAELAKLPHHFGAGHGEEKGSGQLLAGQGGGQVAGAVGAGRIAESEVFVHQPLLVVAFHVGYQVGVVPAAAALRGAAVVAVAEIGAGQVAHGGFVVVVVGIAPNHKAIISQLLGFAVDGEMLKNRVLSGVHTHQVLVIVFPDVDAREVVVAVGIGSSYFLREAAGQVEAVAVNLVFLQPERHHLLREVLGERAFVVQVVVHVVGVGRVAIEPGVVGGGPATVFVQLHHGALAGGVVQHHVEHHGNAAAVGFVDELLQRQLRAVVLIGREVEIGAVAPVVVAVELVDGHQFDGVDAQALDVVERVAQGLIVVAGQEVAQVQLVNHEVGAAGALEAGGRPHVGRLVGLQHRHDARGFAHRVRLQVRVGYGRNVLVVVGVQNFLAVGVGHAQGTVYEVLVSVFAARRQAVDLHPPAVAVRGVVHVAGIIYLPVVELAQHVGKLLVGGGQVENNRRAPGQVGNTVLGPGRQRGGYHSGPHDEHQRVGRLRAAAGSREAHHAAAGLRRRNGRAEGGGPGLLGYLRAVEAERQIGRRRGSTRHRNLAIQTNKQWVAA